MSPNGQSSGHLPAADFAAYLDGRLDAADRARAEAHLADCDECRRELVEIRALLSETESGGTAEPVRPRLRRRIARLGVAAGIAAVLIGVVTTLRRPEPAVERAPAEVGS